MQIHQIILRGIEITLTAIALGLLVPITVLFIECCAALLPSQKAKKPVGQFPRPNVAILVPAHNEALGIEVTLKSLLPQLTEQDQLVVIADNCEDETAAIARATGVQVTERQDSQRRGKGYALDHGLKFLAPDPPDVVVVMDADCVAQAGSIEQIAQQAAATGQPIQAAYLITPPSQPTARDAISSLAVIVKNLVRPKGLARLGFPCLLTGTGMAFPWSVISQAPLATGNIVEDMQLAVDLTIAGCSPIFCPEAGVTSQLPQQEQAAKSQRTRWEHGHLQTIKQQVPRLLRAAFHQRRLDLLALALDLSIPPLSLLAISWAAATTLALLATVFRVSWQPLALLSLEGVLLMGAVAISWAKFASTQLPIQTLLSIPLYILWKIPLYLSFILHPQTKWVRTDRDTVSAPDNQ